ncbi:hypothetical protein DACRYDRAFT_22883 [Dacryopinax primogenitus]|uniref:ARM repeat-containing protein n=1 Tax=Dacryopinax primogenitus (strain DJM 731) TaxID=1858805 RepID=M5FYX2_DACPD|nr:uncharacterized protein DACRYDRAFT_22883 [Dacryopinax primogenitus]EJU01100.1 hypothetical protein DACRYDRAFT_22883 [Dacryopinax primogenitus]
MSLPRKRTWEEKWAHDSALLPYPREPNEVMQERLDLYLRRLAQATLAKDYDPGVLQADAMIVYWMSLKYELPKEKRVAMCKLYYELIVQPGIPYPLVSMSVDRLGTLMRSKNDITIDDIRLPWKPIYAYLKKNTFLNRRQFELNSMPLQFGNLAETCKRFFHPIETDEMLDTFLPGIIGAHLDTLLEAQYYMSAFLPLTHPTSWMPMIFKLWEAFNSSVWDARSFQMLSQVAELHVDPTVSDPKRVREIPDDAREGRKQRIVWEKDPVPKGAWKGLFKDVGIFDEEQWNFMMIKCLATMSIPLADTGSLATGTSTDTQASFEIGRLPPPVWEIHSLARIIVYSMSRDGPASASSGFSTPEILTPGPSGHKTNGLLRDLFKPHHEKVKTYLAGSKALDSFARLIVSTESFFHPSNSGSWTGNLCALVRHVVNQFSKRWAEEQDPECKTPLFRRLTTDMRRELVVTVKTVVLLAMFSKDPTIFDHVMSTIKCICSMEPEIMIEPILERAADALETLVETDRTTAVISALSACGPALVSRTIFPAGAKHLLTILELCVPGIDLNDPTKTQLTTSFLLEVLQHIKIGDLTVPEMPMENGAGESDDEMQTVRSPTIPKVSLETIADGGDPMSPIVEVAGESDEDKLLRESTSRFSTWLSSFFGRVFLMMDNLPEDPEGASEDPLLETVFAVCNQICTHLSEPLFDFVLNLVFDYVTQNVRPNAAGSINSLIACVANGNPPKSMAQFLPHCERVIRSELENGASSIRSTQWGQQRSSDATFHWNLGLLRGLMDGNGKSLLPYKENLLSLLRLLRDKTYSKHGYTWTGELLSDLLLALSHTYPQNTWFVNRETWESADFKLNHHRYWGKNYAPQDVKVEWHVPNEGEVALCMQILQELVQPTLATLKSLFDESVERDAVWRNDVCRLFCFVRNGFTGIQTLWKEHVSMEEAIAVSAIGDVLDEIPEFITHGSPIESGFPLSDEQDPRWQYIANLKEDFGNFVHRASMFLRQHGDENAVDPVAMIVLSIATFFLEYGEAAEDYKTVQEKYNNEKRIARLVPVQKLWPRMVWVRRARLLHAGRLRWNSLDRRQSKLERDLVMDVLEWSLWSFPTIRAAAQNTLSLICVGFDGVRNQCFPTLYHALQPGIDADRMKGALYTLNLPNFARYACSEPQKTPEFVEALFGCQHQEKPSIQSCVAALADNAIGTIAEPNNLIYLLETPGPDNAAKQLLRVVLPEVESDVLIKKCLENRIMRMQKIEKAIQDTVDILLRVATSPNTHWKYSILAIRFLRTLTRRDQPANAVWTEWLFKAVINPNPRVRYYAQRSIQKTLRFIKFRTFCPTPYDLTISRSQNPYKKIIHPKKTNEYTAQYLQAFKTPIREDDIPYIEVQDKASSGWIAWRNDDTRYVFPQRSRHISEWEEASRPAVKAVSAAVLDEAFWRQYAAYLSEETQAESTSPDAIFCIKSIFQLIGDAPLATMRPVLDELLVADDMNKQRAAAEFLAGVITGSKHWALDSQKALWDWLRVQLPTTFKSIKTDTLGIWCSFITTIATNRDPRRQQPLVDYIVANGLEVDFNDQSSFEVVKKESFVRAIDADLGWRFSAWADNFFDRYWEEVGSQHEEVRTYISEAFTLYVKLKWRPRVSVPTAEAFVRECRDPSPQRDVMGLQSGYKLDEFLQLIAQLPKWREERLHGAMAPYSTYDKVAGTLVRFLFGMLHDINAAMAFQYILPMIPELFRMLIMEDSTDLAARSAMLLIRMNGVPMPRNTLSSVLSTLFDVIRTSTSWKVRLYAIPGLQVLYFRQLPSLSDETVEDILSVLEESLMDEVVEVRQAASDTLSGILRCSSRHSVISFKDRFVFRAEATPIPPRSDPNFAIAVRTVHSAILGISALLGAYPYTVPSWCPELMIFLEKHAYDPIPISTTITETARMFRKTHIDTWREDKDKFNEDQLSALSTLITGSSYYA